jgi:hypothetical protein
MILFCPIEMFFDSTQTQNISEKEFLSFMSNTVKIILENKETFLIFYYLNLLNKKISCKEKKEKMIKEFFEKERIFEKNEIIEEDDEFYSQNCNFQASQVYQKIFTFSNEEEMEVLIEITTGIQECVKEKKSTIPKKKKKEEMEEKKLKGIIKRVSRLDDYNPNEGEEDEEEEEEEFFEEEEDEEDEKESESQEDEKEQPKRKRGRPKKIKEEKTRKIVRKKNVTPMSTSVPSPQITKDIESKLKTYFFIQENCVEWKEERIGAKKKILGNYLGKSKKESSNTPTTPTIESTSLQTSQIPSQSQIVSNVNTSSIPSQLDTVYKIPKKKTTTPTTPIDKLVSTPPLQQQPIISTPMPPDISTPYPKDSLFQWCKHHSYPYPQFKEIKNTSEGVVVGVILPHLNNLLFSDAIFSPSLEISENRACLKAIEYMWSLKQPNKQEFVQNDPRRFPQMESNNSDPWRQQNRMNYDPQQKYFQRYDDKNFRY